MGVLRFADEANVARDRGLLFDAAQIGAEFGVGVNAKAAVFERPPEFKGKLRFDRGREGDGLGFPAEPFLRTFGQLHAQAGGVDAAAFYGWEREDAPEFILDLGEGFVLEFQTVTVPEDIADLLADIDHAEVFLAGDVDADVEAARSARMLVGSLALPGEIGEGAEEVGSFGGGDHFPGDKVGAIVHGQAAVLPQPIIFIEGLGAKALDECAARFAAFGDGVNAFDNPLLHGVMDRDAMMAPAHRVAFLFDGADELVEYGIDAPMGGDDGQLAAPGNAGDADGIEFILIFANGEFVQFDVTGAADGSVRERGERVDRVTARKAQDTGLDVLLYINDLLAEVFGHMVQDPSPAFAMVEVKQSGIFIPRGNPHIHPIDQIGSFENRIVGVRVAESNLPGLLDDLQHGLVFNPAPLVGQEELDVRCQECWLGWIGWVHLRCFREFLVLRAFGANNRN